MIARARQGLPWVLAVAIAGCGGAASAVETGPERAEADDGCGPSATRLGAECWSAAGTRWSVAADGPGGEYEFELELLAAGRARSTDDRAASAATDEWFQDGPLLRVFLADRFVEYRARVENGTVLLGDAINVRGQRWVWRGTRQFGENVCREGEARREAACFTVLGTRWRMSDDAVIELLADGALARGGQDPAAENRWEQDGDAVRLSLGGRRYEAQLEGEAELRGTIDGGAEFRATRVESVPPLARR